MRVVVVGAGLLGLTSAYFLREAGCEVSVIERREGPGLETSFANGALLHPSLVDPWNAPGVARVLLRSLGRDDSPMLLRLGALPSLLGWGVAFLRNARPERFRRNALANLALAQYSLSMLADMRSDTGIEYDQYFPGTLVMFRDARSLDGAQATAELLAGQGVRSEQLSAEAMVAHEPALTEVAADIAGGIYYRDDEGGDAHRFCTGLARFLEGTGVEMYYGVSVDGFVRSGRRVDAVLAGTERHPADAVVIAAGSFSEPLLRRIGLAIPVRPAKGYSITVPREAGNAPSPRVPVVDHSLHAAVVPVGADRLRVAGTAEFAGFDTSVRPERVANLFGLLGKVYPSLAAGVAADAVTPWSGLRPMCADGVPLIGETRFENLFLNTGHGHLGWTTSAGSGKLLADMVVGTGPGIDGTPYRLDRF